MLEKKLHINSELAASKKTKDMVNQVTSPFPISFKLINGFPVSQFWINSQPENWLYEVCKHPGIYLIYAKN